MTKSFRSLVDAPYNKKRPLFALRRFIYWKLIRLLKLKNIKYPLWENRALFLNYDSLQSMWIMYNYILDWEEFNLIRNYVQPGDQLLDVGANVGAYSVWMSKFISAPGRLHSFEPDAANYQKLENNVAANKIESLINTNQCALSDLDGVLKFTTGLDRLNHIASMPGDNVVSVPSKKLDSYFNANGISRVTYMKIDVEGFEYTVLKGAHEILSGKRIEIIQLEINDAVQNAGITVDVLLKLLREYDYSLCQYDMKANQLIPVEYHREREDYFAVHDLGQANLKLKSNHNS